MANSSDSVPAPKIHSPPVAITTKTAVDRAFACFQMATCMISEGKRPGAAHQLRTAIKTLDGHPGADDLRRDLEGLLASAILGRTA